MIIIKVTTFQDLQKISRQRFDWNARHSCERNLDDMITMGKGMHKDFIEELETDQYVFEFGKLSKEQYELYTSMMQYFGNDKISYCIEQTDFILYSKVLQSYPDNDVYLVDFKIATDQDNHDVIYNDSLLYSWLDKEGKVVSIIIL